jgi:hypothetical protein
MAIVGLAHAGNYLKQASTRHGDREKPLRHSSSWDSAVHVLSSSLDGVWVIGHAYRQTTAIIQDGRHIFSGQSEAAIKGLRCKGQDASRRAALAKP